MKTSHMNFTKIPIFHEEVVDLVKVVHHLQKSMINFSSLRLRNSIQFLNTSSIRIGLKFVFLNLGSKIIENLLIFDYQSES